MQIVKSDEVNLPQLVTEARAEYLDDMRKKIKTQVKIHLSHIQHYEQLNRQSADEIERNTGRIAEIREAIAKLEAGDWSGIVSDSED